MAKSREWRVWATSVITGVAEPDRICVAKRGIVELVRTAPGADEETKSVVLAALDQQFPGDEAVPIPLLYLGMALREIGTVLQFHRGFEAIKQAVADGVDDLPEITLPGMTKQ